MIVVFVSNQDAVEPVNALLDSRQARQGFAFAKSGVYKEAGALRLEQSDVPRAPRRQNGYAQADRFPPVQRKQISRIIAERRHPVNAENDQEFCTKRKWAR